MRFESENAGWRRLARGVNALALVTAMMLLTPREEAAEAGPPTARVLIMFSNERLLPANIRLDEGFRAGLAEGADSKIDTCDEFLDAVRFSGEEQENAMAEYLRARYASAPPKVIVAVSDQAFRFFIARRGTLFPGVPLVFVGVRKSILDQTKLDPTMTGVAGSYRTGATLDAMRTLLPRLREIVVIVGTTEFDRQWDAPVEEEQKRLSGKVKISYWAGLPFAEVLERVAKLPPDTAVLFMSYLRDPNGKTMVPAEACAEVTSVSSVPVFGIYETYLDRGVAGGCVADFSDYGRSAARIVHRLLSNEAPAQIGVLSAPAPRFVFDARQLDRWKISRRTLPPDSEIRFEVKGLWQMYPMKATGLLAAILAQAALIAALLSNRKRRRRTEGALRVSEERYREVVESQTEMVCRYKTDTTLTFVNEAYCRFFNLTREELLGRSFLRLIPPGAHSAVLAATERLVQERRAISIEHEVLRADGSTGWIQWEDYAVVDEFDEIEELQGIGRDITHRRQAQEELRQSEEKFAGAFRASPSAISINRRDDGLIVDANESWENLFRFRREDALGRTPSELGIFFSEEERLQFRRVLHGQNALRNHELLIRTADGQARWVSLSCELVHLAGDECYISIFHDITERKQLDEARQNLAHSSRLALLGELTASIAHEINQPLGAILSNVEAAEMMLETGRLSHAEIKPILADIRRDDLRASGIIKHIRSLVRKREEEWLPLDLNALVDRVQGLIQIDAQRRLVSLATDLVAMLPDVWADGVQIEQVLLNLMINGMEAMRNVPIEKRALTIRTRLQGERWAEIRVEDAGHGIAPDRLERIFDSFFTTKEEGMGLGLALSRSIAEAHGGNIVAENNVRGGATFCLRLPVYRGEILPQRQ